ncbi:winged helix-turn-helix domain-containing protein [Streptomyces subrutilus]|uniref:Transcriptional regulator n=1 Tax=Streptomyces subrutilus TaxID=36818 RepID=A0A5P2USC0_9ACTN|nr:winged helix-turn-helix domain-containing protein [Streptomyces subrutilus]QEU80404.1 ArsR family transcriptional regulator [Streptomyces subrutilus]WSJ30302.1 helix-turn-helix domain-containing protein [Streptomyces subrutilus]GGZ75834.1 transcriptional regulator [Streptomyces subrutilus]
MPDTPQTPDPRQPQVHLLDARSLRGLAHPLRMRMLATLRHDGPATASQLAGRLGESSGATSYHLRQLAAHGFVEDAPGHGKGRERWWRAVHDGTAFDETLAYDDDPATRGAADLFLHEIATIHTQEMGTWLGDAHSWSQEWRRGADLSDFTLRLTPAQSLELVRRMHALVNEYRDLPAAEGAESVRVHTHAFPRRTGARDAP